jgi:hypothetical protein
VSHPERFPIMSKVVPSIPWAMIAPHEARALRNHGQTLRRLAERGGLSPDEAMRILDDRPWDGRVFVLPRDRAARDRLHLRDAEELKRRAEAWEANP